MNEQANMIRHKCARLSVSFVARWSATKGAMMKASPINKCRTPPQKIAKIQIVQSAKMLTDKFGYDFLFRLVSLSQIPSW